MTGVWILNARIFIVFVAWWFVHSDPEVFITLHFASYLLGWISRLVRYLSGENSEVMKQLDNIGSLFQTATLLFAVISTFSQQYPNSANKLAWKSFNFALIFLIEFVSIWFDVYSKYFAGPRTERVCNNLDWLVLRTYNTPNFNFMAESLALYWIAAQYTSLYPAEFENFWDKEYASYLANLRTYSVIGISSKLAIKLIELKQGFSRIIDYDCDDRKDKESAKAVKQQ